MIIPLLWSTSAMASTWWVQSQYQADTLKQYLDALWPEHELKIQIGESKQNGVWYQHGSLHFRTENTYLQEGVIWDYAMMVSTVRKWHSTVSLKDDGWTPDWAPPPTGKQRSYTS